MFPRYEMQYVPSTVLSTPGTENKFRHFNLNGENNQYSPSTIIVKEGDTIDIGFTSKDRDYNFFLPDLGIYKTVPKGQTQNIQFQGYPYGKYAFYCKDVCGSAKVEGTLIVTKD